MPVGWRSTRGESNSPSGPIPTTYGAKQYPNAVYHLVTSTPEQIEAVGGDELLYADGKATQRRLRGDPHAPAPANSSSRSLAR